MTPRAQGQDPDHCPPGVANRVWNHDRKTEPVTTRTSSARRPVAGVNAVDWPSALALRAIRLYQILLSPYLGRQCRFYPTCSHYAAEAIHTHGLRRGAVLALKRLGRCHPLHAGGVDLVPLPERPAPDSPSGQRSSHSDVAH